MNFYDTELSRAYTYVFNYWIARTAILQESVFNLLIEGRGGVLSSCILINGV